MKTVYTFVKASSLIKYDVIEHKQNENGLLLESKMIGQVDEANYKEIMKHGYNNVYLLDEED